MKRSLNFGFLTTILTLAILYAVSLTGISGRIGFKDIILFGLIFFPITTFFIHLISNK